MDCIITHIDVQGLGEHGCMLVDSFGRPADPQAQAIFDDAGSYAGDYDDYDLY